VEIDGDCEPLLACTVAARAGLVVRTRSPAVDGLVRAAFELLMSHHRLDCVRCPANRRCALQEIARRRRLALRPKGLTLTLPEGTLDESRPEMGLDPTKCVLCALCVWVCNHEVKKGIIDCIGRGLSARVGTFDGRPLASQGCGECVRCAEVCPVGAIYLRQQK
jgi:predicted molibdopterin-dependent oxidoreductase YjgC